MSMYLVESLWHHHMQHVPLAHWIVESHNKKIFLGNLETNLQTFAPTKILYGIIIRLQGMPLWLSVSSVDCRFYEFSIHRTQESQTIEISGTKSIEVHATWYPSLLVSIVYSITSHNLHIPTAIFLQNCVTAKPHTGMEHDDTVVVYYETNATSKQVQSATQLPSNHCPCWDAWISWFLNVCFHELAFLWHSTVQPSCVHI